MMPGKWISTTALVLLATVLLAVLSGCSAEKTVSRNFTVNRYTVQAVLSDDGSAVITETVEYSMLKSSRNFKFNIPYAEAGSVTLRQVAISSGSDSGQEQYVVVQAMNNTSNSNASASYEMQDNGNTLQIAVNVLSEAGSRRNIRLTYTLAQAVALNTDNAYLKRDFFISAAAEKVGQAALSVQLPADAADVEIWYLPVSLTDYSDSRPRESLITFTGSPSMNEQKLTLYCLMPKTMFSRATAAFPGKSWETLTADAKKAGLILSETDMAKDATLYLVFILLAVSIILVLLIYWFYDRECAATFLHRYWQKSPGVPPAILAVLMRKDKPGQLMLATLLDLVRRGELRLQGNVFSLPASSNREYYGFAAFEIFLVQWLFDSVACDTMISTAEIRRHARDAAATSEMHEYYNQFRHLIDEAIEQRGLIDHWRMRRGRTIAGLTSSLYLLLAVGLPLFLNSMTSLLLLIPAVFLAVYAWQIRRLSPAGRDLYAMARALQRSIRDGKGVVDGVESLFFRDMMPLSVAIDNSSRLIDHLLTAGKDSSDPFSEFCLDIYGIEFSARPWQDQVLALGGNIRIMTAMLAASLLLTAEHKNA